MDNPQDVPARNKRVDDKKVLNIILFGRVRTQLQVNKQSNNLTLAKILSTTNLQPAQPTALPANPQQQLLPTANKNLILNLKQTAQERFTVQIHVPN